MHICNYDVCLRSTFVLIENLSESVILMIPFLTSIFLFKLDTCGLASEVFGKLIFYKFIFPPREKEVKTLKEKSLVKFIKNKEQYMNYLTK